MRDLPQTQGTETLNRNLRTQQGASETDLGIQQAFRLVDGEVDQLLRARRAIDLKLQKAVAARDLLRQMLHSSDEESEDTLSATDAERHAGKRFHRGSLTYEVVTRSREIIRAAGRPLSRSELLSQITASGFTIQASNPARFIGRALWEDPAFIHVERKGYWISSEKIPQDSF